MKILIKVTKEILVKTQYCVSACALEHCAIAEAVRDIFPGAYVDNHHIYVEPYSFTYRPLQLPKAARDFIIAFDRTPPHFRLGLHHISFKIEVPDELIESIGIREVYKILSESKTLKYTKFSAKVRH